MLSRWIREGQIVHAPVVFNALSALMAARAGFAAAYVGGASLGYMRGTTEAALTALDFAQVGLEINSSVETALIADAGVGWGDPVHMHRYVPLLEAAGYQALELEDQVVPKRVHHHVGVEHLVPAEEMAAKVREAVAARRSPDTMIIARTNALGRDRDEAAKRCELYARAGADMLFPISGDPELLRFIGERSDLPLMMMIYPGRGFSALGIPRGELAELGFRLIVDAVTPLAAMVEGLADAYDNLESDSPRLGVAAALDRCNELVGLERLLEVERATTERPV